MPGISICFDRTGLDAQAIRRADNAAAALLHNERYTTQRLFQSAHALVYFSAYPEYCRHDFSTDEYFIFLEGAIYNRSAGATSTALLQFAQQLRSNVTAGIDSIAEWVLGSDGEFIVVIAEKSTGALFIFNDGLGRLPFHKYKTSNRFYLCREPKFALLAEGSVTQDRVGLAEYLIYGFNLGTRTLSQGVRRVLPAQLIQIAPATGSITEHTTHVWNFQNCVDPTLRAKPAATRLADLFIQATKNRVTTLQPRLNALALSGGLDSRAVLAAFENAQLPYWAHSNTAANQPVNYDFRITQQLTEKVGRPLTAYPLTDPTLDDYYRLARQNEGSGSAIMAIAMVHFHKLYQQHGPQLCLYTGDGGGNVMYPLTPAKPFKSTEDILGATLHTLCFTPLDQVSRLLRIDVEEVLAASADAFDSFPESEPTFKYAHYKIFGRPWRFIMEGEDRVRFHFWLGAPFWSPDILRLMMSLPDHQKINYQLYREFLRRLLPQVLEVPYANIKIRIDSPWIGLHNFIKGAILSRPWLYHRVRALRDPAEYRADAPHVLHAELLRITRESQSLSEYFDVDEVRKSLEGGMSRISYHLLAALILRVYLLEHNFAIPTSGQ